MKLITQVLVYMFVLVTGAVACGAQEYTLNATPAFISVEPRSVAENPLTTAAD